MTLLQTLFIDSKRDGTVADKKRSGRPSVVRTAENRAVVQAAFSKNPTLSTRRAACELGISRVSIQRMLFDLKLRPYRPRLVLYWH